MSHHFYHIVPANAAYASAERWSTFDLPNDTIVGPGNDYKAGIRLKAKFQTWIHRFLRAQSGVTAIEYGLLAALIAITIIGAVRSVGTQLEAVYVFWSSAVAAAITGAL